MINLRGLLNKEELIVAGLMSGTSLDGVDTAIVRIRGRGFDATVELLHSGYRAYDNELRERLKLICTEDASNTAWVCGMNFHIGRVSAEAVMETAAQAGLALQDIDLISSHGQTVWHIPQPDPNDPYLPASTLQIGDLSVIAKLTGIPVVGDFRTADMAVGGQGAPLVPYGDYLLYRDPREGRIAQNIGGIGNCTAIPAGGSAADVIAFDTGPGNMVIDQAVWLLSGGKLTYDRGGEWAARGSVNPEMLEEMLSHPYFSQAPAKTTGRELFGKTYAQKWVSRAVSKGLSPDDIVATVTAFTAHSIARGYRDFILPRMSAAEVIVSGGGAHNATLMRMLSELLPEQRVRKSDESGLPSDAKEAVLFALLGYNFLHGEPNNVPAATGASRSTVMGKLALPE